MQGNAEQSKAMQSNSEHVQLALYLAWHSAVRPPLVGVASDSFVFIHRLVLYFLVHHWFMKEIIPFKGGGAQANAGRSWHKSQI